MKIEFPIKMCSQPQHVLVGHHFHGAVGFDLTTDRDPIDDLIVFPGSCFNCENSFCLTLRASGTTAKAFNSNKSS